MPAQRPSIVCTGGIIAGLQGEHIHGLVVAVIGKDGVETEIQVGQMRQTLGKPGFDWLFNKH